MLNEKVALNVSAVNIYNHVLLLNGCLIDTISTISYFMAVLRGIYPNIELEYYNNTYVVGWVIFKNEEFTQYINTDLKRDDILAAKNWALRVIDEHLS
jgi:hypothetical protein